MNRTLKQDYQRHYDEMTSESFWRAQLSVPVPDLEKEK